MSQVGFVLVNTRLTVRSAAASSRTKYVRPIRNGFCGKVHIFRHAQRELHIVLICGNGFRADLPVRLAQTPVLSFLRDRSQGEHDSSEEAT